MTRYCCQTSMLYCLVLLLGASPVSAGTAEEAAYAEELVSQVYFEGLPAERASAITDAGRARLVEMLQDPAYELYGPNIVMALGIGAGAGAYEALASAAADVPVGEVDRHEYRKRLALRIALGHLARSDDRALAWLKAEALQQDVPSWWFRSTQGSQLGQALRRQSIRGLALSGRPDAATVLRQIEGQAVQERSLSAADPELVEQVREALDLHARVAAELRGTRTGDSQR